MIDKLIKFYRLLNILSIDVALGAACSAAWFGELFEVNVRPYALISLGLTVWIIYTLDHLLDARKVKNAASTPRHRFHQENLASLLVAIILATILDLFFVFFIRMAVFQAGVLLSVIIAIYFLLQQHIRYIKEFIIAFLFSCGVLLPAWSLSPTRPDLEFTLLISQFALTALLNLILFSWFDRHTDHQDKRESFVTLIGEAKARRILWILFMLNASLMMGSILYSPQLIYNVLIIFFMNTILMMVFVKHERFEVNDRFRLIGDSVFLFPALYLLV
jgi:4-hydroxybenzoate polyprenyltransferase